MVKFNLKKVEKSTILCFNEPLFLFRLLWVLFNCRSSHCEGASMCPGRDEV